MTANDLITVKRDGDSRGCIIKSVTVSRQALCAALNRLTYAMHHNGKSLDGIKWDKNFQAQA